MEPYQPLYLYAGSQYAPIITWSLNLGVDFIVVAVIATTLLRNSIGIGFRFLEFYLHSHFVPNSFGRIRMHLEMH